LYRTKHYRRYFRCSLHPHTPNVSVFAFLTLVDRSVLFCLRRLHVASYQVAKRTMFRRVRRELVWSSLHFASLLLLSIFLIFSFTSIALIRRLKFRLHRSDRFTPQPSSVAASPSAQTGRSGTSSFNSAPADPSQIPAEGRCRRRLFFLWWFLAFNFHVLMMRHDLLCSLRKIITSAGFGAAVRMASTVANFMRKPS
jgi:hypothetical protein